MIGIKCTGTVIWHRNSWHRNSRKGLGLTRPVFCRRFALDVRAVQDWEQKRRRPDRAARAYLMVIEKNPQAVEAALSAA